MPSPPNQYLTFYRHLGFDNLKLVKGQYVRSCFFCGRDDLHGISPDTGQYNCHRCGNHGNIYTFMQALLDESLRLTVDSDYYDLARNRGLSYETLKVAKLAKSTLNGNWLIPSFKRDGTENKLVNLYQAIAYEELVKAPRVPPRRKVKYEIRSAAAPCTQQLYGIETVNKQDTIIIVEGHWDRLALWEVFAHLHPQSQGCFSWNPHVKGMPDYFGGIFEQVAIVGVPGANIFREEWARLLRDKAVILCYDNDPDRVVCPSCRGTEGYKAHLNNTPCPKCGRMETTGQIINPGRDGQKKVIKELDEFGIQPRSLMCINWRTTDPKDIRDLLVA